MAEGGSGLLSTTERRELYCIVVLWAIYGMFNVWVYGDSEFGIVFCGGLLFIIVLLWVRLVGREIFCGRGGCRR